MSDDRLLVAARAVVGHILKVPEGANADAAIELITTFNEIPADDIGDVGDRIRGTMEATPEAQSFYDRVVGVAMGIAVRDFFNSSTLTLESDGAEPTDDPEAAPPDDDDVLEHLQSQLERVTRVEDLVRLNEDAQAAMLRGIVRAASESSTSAEDLLLLARAQQLLFFGPWPTVPADPPSSPTE